MFSSLLGTFTSCRWLSSCYSFTLKLDRNIEKKKFIRRVTYMLTFHNPAHPFSLFECRAQTARTLRIGHGISEEPRRQVSGRVATVVKERACAKCECDQVT